MLCCSCAIVFFSSPGFKTSHMTETVKYLNPYLRTFYAFVIYIFLTTVYLIFSNMLFRKFGGISDHLASTTRAFTVAATTKCQTHNLKLPQILADKWNVFFFVFIFNFCHVHAHPPTHPHLVIESSCTLFLKWQFYNHHLMNLWLRNISIIVNKQMATV